MCEDYYKIGGIYHIYKKDNDNDRLHMGIGKLVEIIGMYFIFEDIYYEFNSYGIGSYCKRGVFDMNEYEFIKANENDIDIDKYMKFVKSNKKTMENGDICLIYDKGKIFGIGKYKYETDDYYEVYDCLSIHDSKDLSKSIEFDDVLYENKTLTKEYYDIKLLEDENLMKSYENVLCLAKNDFKYNSNDMISISPIMEFENQNQLNECLKWWQDKLQLNDWIISAYLNDEILYNNEKEECLGLHKSDYVQKNSYIDISTYKAIQEYLEKEDSSINYKVCHELILVHELLHVKIPMFENEDSSIGNVFYEINQHALIESLAKTLIMAKYDLDFDWFKVECDI